MGQREEEGNHQGASSCANLSKKSRYLRCGAGKRSGTLGVGQFPDRCHLTYAHSALVGPSWLAGWLAFQVGCASRIGSSHTGGSCQRAGRRVRENGGVYGGMRRECQGQGVKVGREVGSPQA